MRDLTGNRRFWPVDLGERNPGKHVHSQLEGEVDQIWAEAVIRWRCGEKLYLEDEDARGKAAGGAYGEQSEGRDYP